MPHSSNKENVYDAKKRSRYRCIHSARIAEAKEAMKAKFVKECVATLRDNKRGAANHAQTIVERLADSEEVRELKERLHRAEAKHEAAKSALAQTISATPEFTEVDIIPRPTNLRGITIESIRRQLNMEGDANKAEWLELRNNIRHSLVVACVDWSLPWTHQKYAKQVLDVYDEVEEAFPSLRRFQNQWAVEHLAKEAFTAHRSYRACKNDPTKYRGKLARMRRARRQHLGSGSEDDDSSE